MTDIIDVEYSSLESTEICEACVAELEERYGLRLGKHVRQIRGIFGVIVLFFQSKIGLNYPLRGREWEVTYEAETGPAGEGLVAIRPGADKPLSDEDYEHLYRAWERGRWPEVSQLHLYFDGELYEVYGHSGAPANRLYLQKLEPCGR